MSRKPPFPVCSVGYTNAETTHHYDKNAKVVPVSIEVLDGGLEVA